MGYKRNLKEAARRHNQAADYLYKQAHRRDVAGYLYGIAAECALKEIMRISGIRELSKEDKRNDPYYAHFPDLKTLLRDRAQGRCQGVLLKYANDQKLMCEWNTTMRYSPCNDVQHQHVELWRDQACEIVKKMEEEASVF
jgi:hypothetical protein